MWRECWRLISVFIIHYSWTCSSWKQVTYVCWVCSSVWEVFFMMHFIQGHIYHSTAFYEPSWRKTPTYCFICLICIASWRLSSVFLYHTEDLNVEFKPLAVTLTTSWLNVSQRDNHSLLSVCVSHNGGMEKLKFKMQSPSKFTTMTQPSEFHNRCCCVKSRNYTVRCSDHVCWIKLWSVYCYYSNSRPLMQSRIQTPTLSIKQNNVW